MCDAGGRREVVIVLQGMRLVKFAWQITVCSYLMLNEHLSFLRTAPIRYQPPRPKSPRCVFSHKEPKIYMDSFTNSTRATKSDCLT